MKSTAVLFAAAAAGLFFVSCERHEWEETKVLHEKHDHGHAAAGHGEEAHGDAHHGDAKEKHGEEKAH